VSFYGVCVFVLTCACMLCGLGPDWWD